MRVKLKDLKPNPYRNIKHYPIDNNKVDMLCESIKKTGFWDNVVARQMEGEVQLAYGHHRLFALQKLFKPTDEVSVIVKPLSDPDMIRVMADENDEYYGTSPAVINETVKVARDYLKEHSEEVSTLRRRSDFKKEHPWSSIVAMFLGWRESRIREALEALGDIEDEIINKDAYEKFPTQFQADEFRRHAKKVGLTHKQQKEVAEELVSSKKGYRHVKQAVLEKKFNGKPKQKKTEYEINEVAHSVADSLNKITILLNDEFFASWSCINGNARTALLASIKNFVNRISKIKSGRAYEQITSKCE
jgi:hypothetical protein